VADTTPTPAPSAAPRQRSSSRRAAQRALLWWCSWSSRWSRRLWWHSTFSEDTDDAQVNGHLIQVSSRISGQVIKVDVEENQVVKAGDTIAELDPATTGRGGECRGALASAEANAAAANVNVPITSINTGSNLLFGRRRCQRCAFERGAGEQQLQAAHARVAQAEANNVKAEADLERYKPLVEKDVISKQQWDAAVAAAMAPRPPWPTPRLRSGRRRWRAGCRSRTGGAGAGGTKYAETGPQQVEVQTARAKQAQAQVAAGPGAARPGRTEPELHQNRGSCGGHHHPQERGNQPERRSGQNLLTLVSLEDLWITANFKETQLKAHVRGPAGGDCCRRHRQEVPRQGDADWRSHRLGAQPLSAGERDRELRQGGAARSSAHRLHRPEERRPLKPRVGFLLRLARNPRSGSTG
jgi:membrane fusion protein, multidrug efflux system